MSNEEQGKNIQWQNKLENMEHLPSPAFDKDASWNKLHERLQNKKKRMPVWYWAAAACLFFAIMIALMMDNNASHLPKKDDIAIKKPEKTSKTALIDKNLAVNEIKPAITNKKTEQANKINKIIKKEDRVITPTTVSKISFTNTVEVLNNRYLADPLPVSNTLLATSLMPLQKKKLNVVHVNELGDPVNDFPVADHIDKRAFKFEIAKEEVVSSAVSQSTNFTISKIKSTSN